MVLTQLLLIVAGLVFLVASIGFAIDQKYSSMNRVCFEMSPLLERLKEEAEQLGKTVQTACWRHERRITIAEALARVSVAMRSAKDTVERLDG